MRQSQEILKATDISLYRRYLQQMLVVMAILLFSLTSGSVFALTLNDGSATTCPAGSTKGILSNASYDTLITSARNGSYEAVNSGSSSTIPLRIRMSITDFNISDSGSTTASGTATYNAIDIRRTFADQTSSTEVTLDFQNSLNNDDLFLSKVAMSTFDIDKFLSTNSYWDDKVVITGITQSGATINGTFQTISGSNVINSSGLRLPASPTSANCSTTLDTTCQGSVVFSDPVKSVTLRYTNTGENTSRTPTSQVLQFRLDSYCYAPSASYSITKDDNKSSVTVNGSTDYTVKITNTGQSSISNITLKDPAVTGLLKQSGISCSSLSDTTNTCPNSTLPTIAQLEGSGFPVPTLAVGKSYSIIIPTVVTAASNSNVTNTATISHATIATRSASDTNSVTLSSSSGTTAAATCPAGHKMYYVGGSIAPSYSPMATPKTLAWTSGSLEDAFIFAENSGNKIFNFRLTGVDLSVNEGRSSPFFGGVDNATANAINFVHSSPSAKSNNSVNLSVNRPVSRIGYKIQDLDSFGTGTTLAYIEQATALNSGVLTSFPSFHTILQNISGTTVTGIEGQNCGINGCTIDATWGYTPANTEVSLIHRNSKTFTNSDHAVGYSDFYFCLAPPKLVVKKVLSGNRVNDSVDNADQFEIKVTGDSVATNSVTTTGSGATITNGSSSVLELAESKTYTISERVINGSVSNYSATYVCNNATTGSTFTTTNGTATLNAGNIPTRSFTLANLNYGDEITCTITNTPSVYTFTGFVFNDNGGITASESTKQNISSTFVGNQNYFNGIFDTNESGIGASGLQVRLTNCGLNGGTNIAGTTAQNISTTASAGLLLGQYKFTVPASVIAGLSPQKVCLVQVEPSDWEYSIDTTPNTREVNLVANTFDYKTESNGSRNLDFGEVQTNNASLVLIKSQYVHSCNINANYNATTGTSSQTPVFSTTEINSIEPGKCIAYRIEAYNRGHVDLSNIEITDTLQTTPVKSIFVSPLPLGSPVDVNKNTTTLPIDKIVSNPFNLVKATGSVPTVATLFFNTKYGTTSNSTP